jgi:hypothetical protein
MEVKVDATRPTPESRRMRRPRKHKPHFDLHGQLYRINGMDRISGGKVLKRGTRHVVTAPRRRT